VLKVEFEKELRRISLPTTLALADVKQKLATMFSLDDTSFVITAKEDDVLSRIMSDEDYKQIVLKASQKNPPLMRLVVSQEAETPRVPETIALCKNCASVVQSGMAYYKCLNCLSYELCEACEANGSHAEHLLVKLRQPADSLPREKQLVFLKHIIDPIDRAVAHDLRQLLCETEDNQAAVEEPKTLPQPEPIIGQEVERNLNVSLLMSEFQEVEVVPEAAKPATTVEPSVEREVAAFNVIESEPETPVEELPVAETTVIITKEEDKEPAPAPVEPAHEEKKPEKPNPFKANLEALEQMGFSDRDKNIRALVKHVNNLEAALNELLLPRSWFLPDLSKFGL